MNRPRRSDRRGFGLLELSTALAFLVILLGLAVSLARYVRATSAEQITRDLLRTLDVDLARRAEPVDPPQSPPIGASESAWAAYAARSNESVVRALAGASEVVLDAWGNPVSFLALARSEIGMAPHDRPFCFSAGPDGRYLTQADNLYSYEQIAPARYTTAPSAGGHGE